MCNIFDQSQINIYPKTITINFVEKKYEGSYSQAILKNILCLFLQDVANLKVG